MEDSACRNNWGCRQRLNSEKGPSEHCFTKVGVCTWLFVYCPQLYEYIGENPKISPRIQRGLFKWMDFHVSIKNDDIFHMQRYWRYMKQKGANYKPVCTVKRLYLWMGRGKNMSGTCQSVLATPLPFLWCAEFSHSSTTDRLCIVNMGYEGLGGRGK